MNSSENYRLKKMARLCKGAEIVLDIGCAEIPNTFLKNKQVIGYDIQSMILPQNYHHAVQDDIVNLKKHFSPELFDAILAGEILEHLQNPYPFIQDCFHLLKPGGKLIISTPNPNNVYEQILTIFLIEKYFFDPEHFMLYPQRWLIRMLKYNGFRHVKLLSGGLPTFAGFLIPFPRPWCYQTIACAIKE